MQRPTTYQDFKNDWQSNQYEYIKKYINKENSFIPNLLPEQAVQLSTTDTFKILHQRLGGNVMTVALNPANTFPSPVASEKNPEWIKSVNMVGINVRTIGSFWNMVKYMLTIPDVQSSVHILPIWEVGVVASLYGISSWNINPEFFDEELYRAIPTLDTVEKQLKVVVNFLHAMGKSVGMDVIPHTDRYSQVVLAHPHFFEWLQRDDLKITNHRANLHEEVQDLILSFLEKNGTATPIDYPKNRENFFYDFDENNRLLALFGEKRDYNGRLKRRNALVQHLYNHGFEPVPATMAPPYRGLKVSEDEATKVIDKDGRVWRDYVISEPQEMSRVFGPLTRFKLYERLNDNQNWEIDFEQPRPKVWEYVAQKYAQIQQEFNFDFMRGDMSHVQMRAEGVPAKVDAYYDILKNIKNHIQTQTPYFGYFAETFIAPAGHMAFGDEIDHLEASEAETTLGDLQSLPVHTPAFQQRFRYYLDILETRSVIPNFTMMTGDKDDPRFDKFYVAGNEARFFIGLFLENMPSYMALGFESRDVHLEPAPNEHYTKLYVFQINEGPKATHSPYIWGKNVGLFHILTQIKIYAEKIHPKIQGQATRWLLPPDATGHRKFIAWTQKDKPQYIFIVNLDTENEAVNLKIPTIKDKLSDTSKVSDNLTLDFSTADVDEKDKNLMCLGKYYQLESLKVGECRSYKIV